MIKNKKNIPIFFAVDDEYTPFLAVTLQSLVDNSSLKNEYQIKILHTNISIENKEKIKKFGRENISIEFVDLNYYIERVKDKLYTRDYYTKTTYFRLFIPNLYPQYDKVIYLDSDVILLKDVAELYNVEIGNNLIAAVPDDIIQSNEVFQEYVEKVVGVASYKNYFNAGVLVMNLDELRKFNFQEKFMYLLGTVKFLVVQDQDYLNRLCKGRVTLLDYGWNRMPLGNNKIKEEDIKLIHYNYVYKPWHFENTQFKEYFWKYAEKTEYYDKILEIKNNYTEEQRFADRESDKALRELAQKESDCVGDDRRFRWELKLKRKKIKEKSKDRLEILEEIEKLEREGRFDVDPEKDPPTIVLTPDNVDYLNEKSTSKVKTKVANIIGKGFLKEILRTNRLIIKEINGIENLDVVSSGAIITCNHFNPFDCFTVETAFRNSKQFTQKSKKLYKVIREGNYTNFPGFYGFLFRNCDTLPLSSNQKTMVEFMKAVDTILKRGDFILIYPEQSLWWNYKKPKPLKDGAFRMAYRNNVPVVPIFITFEESNITGNDGFPIMEYYVNIKPPIYPDLEISTKENAKIMREKNFDIWKNVYEEFYRTPLKYTTIDKKEKI